MLTKTVTQPTHSHFRETTKYITKVQKKFKIIKGVETMSKKESDFNICPVSTLRLVLFKVAFFYYPATEQHRLVQ